VDRQIRKCKLMSIESQLGCMLSCLNDASVLTVSLFKLEGCLYPCCACDEFHFVITRGINIVQENKINSRFCVAAVKKEDIPSLLIVYTFT
jgi:hypothetical protein